MIEMHADGQLATGAYACNCSTVSQSSPNRGVLSECRKAENRSNSGS